MGFTTQDDSYPQQVNRRLAQSFYLLSLLTSKGATSELSSPIARSAILNAVLLHFYYAAVSYLNELLSYYRRAPLSGADIPFYFSGDDSLGQLDSLQNKISRPKENRFDGVHEYGSLIKWSESHGRALEILLTFHTGMTLLNRHSSDHQTTMENDTGIKKIDPNLIAVSSDKRSGKKKCNFDSEEEIKIILSSFQQFVYSQREHQQEY